MQSQIGKWGSSLAFRIPRHIVQEMNLQPDQTVTVSIENSRLVIEPVRSTQKYTLDQLLEEEIEEDDEVSWGKPEGEEVW